MKNLDFKYIEAKNFLCFGNEGIRIEFDNIEKICFVKGQNVHFQCLLKIVMS